MSARILPALGAVCCTAELAPGFEEALTVRYHCGTTWFVAADPEHTVRLQVGFPSESPTTTGSTFDSTDEHEAELPDPRALVLLYAGDCLYLPGCSDVFGSPQCTQHIDGTWKATRGTVRLAPGDVGEVQATFDDVLLEDLASGQDPLPLDWTATADHRG